MDSVYVQGEAPENVEDLLLAVDCDARLSLFIGDLWLKHA